MTAQAQKNAHGLDGVWKRLCDADEPNDDLGVKVELDDGHGVTAFRVDDEYFVIDDLCTHGSASLADGFVEGCIVECPFHGGKFDMRTGEPVAFPCVLPLKVYASKVMDGALYALITDTSVEPKPAKHTDDGANE